MPTVRPRASWAATVGILALAFNLRPAAVSVGPVLDELSADLRMTPTVAGILTSLPVLAFALVGAVTPRLTGRLGQHPTALLALAAVVVGLSARALSGSAWPFLLLSFVALAGMAAANVLLPVLVRGHAPDRVGHLTAAYTTSLAVGLTSAFVLTVPLGSWLGSWRWGLAAWAVPAALAAVCWAWPVRPGQAGRGGQPVPTAAGTTSPARVSVSAVARTPLGWAMATCFGLQSLQAYAVFGWFAQLYRDAGFSAATAGLLLGVVAGVSVPISVVAPHLAARSADQTRLFMALLACYVAGYAGLALAPRGGALLWAVLVGVGMGVFPVVLTLIGLRADTAAGTAALSGFTQSVGYLLAAVGPLGVGLLYELTGGWALPLVALLVLLVPLAGCAVYVSRPRLLEDQLRRG